VLSDELSELLSGKLVLEKGLTGSVGADYVKNVFADIDA
jgi:hypothetical protein